MRWTKAGQAGRYVPTPDDELTLARAIAREGKPQGAVAYALLQRFALLHPKYPTLAEFVAAYAQPINPRWFTDGDLHLRRLRQLAHDPEAKAAEVARAQRREEYAAVPWEDIPPQHRQLALEALDGQAHNPVPGAVHFRAPIGVPKGATESKAKAVAQKYAKARNYLALNVGTWLPGSNWFFATPQSRSVRILEDGGDREEDLIDPKADSGDGQLLAPPPGAPAGPGWGWRWCFYGPSHDGAADEADG